MSELKPCPFCGSTKICTEKSINLNFCDNCSAESNIEHWNTRPIEDALTARIAELEGELDRRIAMPKDLWFKVAQLSTRINELEAERRWIPVGERLPEAYEKVIALAKDCMNVDWVLPKELREVGKGAFARLYNVTHWMPLPEPPIVYGKVCEE